MNLFFKRLPFIILFLLGYEFLVPVEIIDTNTNILLTYPFWANKIQLIPGVLLSEVLIIFYFLGFIITKRGVTLPKMVKNYIFLIILLFFLGLISLAFNLIDIYNLIDINDLLEASRFLLLANLFLFCYIWANNLGATFVLRTFLLGALISALINLYFSFTISTRVIGILPLLNGQNGPGGAISFMLGLSAWLFLISKKKKDKIVSVIFVLVGSYTTLVSFSKLALFMGIFGLIAWVAILINNDSYRKYFKFTLFSTLILVIGLILWINTTKAGQKVGYSVEKIWYYKVSSDDEGFISADGGDNQRIHYFFGVTEILFRNPIGVSYSGFRNAIMSTVAYSWGDISEDPDYRGSNPHNSFLYYTATNGFPGMIVVILLLIIFLKTLKNSLLPYGKSGRIVAICITISVIIYGNTLPGLFSTSILYLPAAVAFSLTTNRMKVDKLQNKLILQNSN